MSNIRQTSFDWSATGMNQGIMHTPTNTPGPRDFFDNGRKRAFSFRSPQPLSTSTIRNSKLMAVPACGRVFLPAFDWNRLAPDRFTHMKKQQIRPNRIGFC